MGGRTLLNGVLGITIAVLVGCGGGGGGGSTPPPPPANATLGGTAAKGIIKNGNVAAKELDASGNLLAQVGSAVTGADGSYSLTLGSNYGGGPIQVTISADADTEMKCDVPVGCGTAVDAALDVNNNSVIDFGEWYKPGSLTMSALVAEAAASDTISVNITPFTDMAANRAMEAGTLDAAAVYNANSEVSVLLGGIDILNTEPLDITDVVAIGDGSATEIAYAAFSAAIAALADPDVTTGNPDIDGALASLSSSFSGGTIAADALQDIVTGAVDTLAATATGDTSGTIAAVQDVVTTAAAGTGSVDPAPSPDAGDTTLAKVKAFVADVRTWGTVIDAEIGAQGDAFGEQVDLASTASDLAMEFLVSPAFEAALDAIVMNLSGVNTSSDLSTYAVGFVGDPQFTAGTITNTGGVISITGGVIDYGLDVTVNISVQLPENGITTSNLTIGINSASFDSSFSNADINSGIVTINLAAPYTVDWAAVEAGTTVFDIAGASVDLDVALTQKETVDMMTGDLMALASPVTFAGALSATLTNPITVDVTDPITGEVSTDITWITPSTLTLAGSISNTSGNSLDADFTINVTNADTFTPVGELPLGTIKTGIVSWAYVGDTFTLTSPELTLTIQRDSGTSVVTITEDWGYGPYSYPAGSYASIGEAVAAGPSVLSWYLTTGGFIWVDGEGGYTVGAADYSADGSVNGTLVDPEFVLEGPAANQWLAGTIGLDFALQLAGLPEASINISGARTMFEAGTATITIAYGARQMMIDAGFATDPVTNVSTATGEMTITNQDGVSLIIDGDFEASTGDVMFNGTSYATISQLANGLTKITYSDGTFEIL